MLFSKSMFVIDPTAHMVHLFIFFT